MVKCPTFGFGSGPDLMVHGFKPSHCLHGACLGFPLCPSSPPTKINTFKKKIIFDREHVGARGSETGREREGRESMEPEAGLKLPNREIII